jgi:hypothetical protein
MLAIAQPATARITAGVRRRSNGMRKKTPPMTAAITGLAAPRTAAITGFEWATPIVKMKAKPARPSQPGMSARHTAGRTVGRANPSRSHSAA